MGLPVPKEVKHPGWPGEREGGEVVRLEVPPRGGGGGVGRGGL